jgi:general secretion pathway protein G
MNIGGVEMVSRRERGLTLVELMVVIVLIGLLAGVVTTAVFPVLFKGKNTVAASQIKVFDEAIRFYYLQHSRYPDSLDELVQPDPEHGYENGYLDGVVELPLDPWNEFYEYDPQGGTGKPYLIYSKGPDMIEGTDDDITNESSRSSGGTE